jgi:long-chain fatty acid transport protein
MLHKTKVSVLAISACATMTSGASAGGYAAREQSAQFQGSSFAGSAAGGALSSMFWNPAAASQAGAGLATESSYSGIFSNTTITALPPSANFAFGADSGNIDKPRLVSGSYGAYRLSDKLVLGASFNSPFALTTEAKTGYAGSFQATTSVVKTYNLNAVLSYQLGNGFSIAAGPQIQYLSTVFKRAVALGPLVNVVSDNSGTGVGAVAGVLWEPTKATTVGLGYRSAVSHSMKGDYSLDKTAGTVNSTRSDITTPDMLTLSVRQTVAPQWTALGTVEWTNWSRTKQFSAVCDGSGPLCPAGSDGKPVDISAANWNNGWFVSAGLEHAYSAALTLRTGLSYEKSPIQSAADRPTSFADSDKISASLGGSYAFTQSTTLNLAYSHVFTKDAQIDRTANTGRLLADVSSRTDIISAGLKTKW